MRILRLLAAAACAVAIPHTEFAGAQTAAPAAVLTGKAAFGDWRADAPGVRRHISAGDLPPPFASASTRNRVETAPDRREGLLKAPTGFAVTLFAKGLNGPRLIRAAPNGDIFVAESGAGRLRVLRPSADGGSVSDNQIFASGLNRPFGIAFYPNDGKPEWVYVANTDSVVRFPYRAGDLKARGAPEMIVPRLPTGGNHWTRDVVFSKDGKRMFVSVGSASNVAQDMPPAPPGGLQNWVAENPLGAAWGAETERADVLLFDPQGKNRRIFATGIRNCVGMDIHPATGDLWCSTNERDLLGDDLPPDYLTRVREGAFYGWPWYYTGAHQDPRHKNARPDLADKITVPDVLLQPHSAPLGMVFYNGNQFPAEYKGQAFAALHGSWNRTTRTGYKIVRAIVKEGVPTGEYEDFVIGFVINDANAWGRPVGVTVAKDGSLLFSEDGNGTIWRVTYSQRASAR
ncbi:MAG: sorbosone dehydrogenase family protein [Xanthobacteraceae bacterium]